MTQFVAEWLRFALMAAVLTVAVGVIYVAMLWWPAALLLLFVLVKRRRAPLWEMGTARLASFLDLFQSGMTRGNGPILGRAEMHNVPFRTAIRLLFIAPLASSVVVCNAVASSLGMRRPGPLLRTCTNGHILTISPTGGGKGVGLAIPNLLYLSGAFVTTDLKNGENFKLISAYRAKTFGRPQIHLDAFGAIGSEFPPPFAVNGFDLIDRDSPTLLDDIRAVFAQPLIPRTGREGDGRFFLDTAESVLTAVCAFVACHAQPHERHLVTALKLLSNHEAFVGTLASMRESDACGGGLSDLAGQVSFLKERTFSDVMATLSQHLAVFVSPTVRDSLQRTTFDWDAYTRGELDLYVCLTADKIHSHAAIVRHQLSVLVYALLVKRGLTRDPNHRILFLLDEIGHLGPVQILTTSLTLMRGYGVQLWYILQGLGMLKKCFPEDGGETALANFDLQQFYELNGMAEAEYCSARCGTATIPVTTQQSGTGWSATRQNGTSPESYSTSGNDSTSVAPAGRKLFLPEEVLGPQMQGRSLIFARGSLPILAERLTYYSDPDFQNLLDPRSPSPKRDQSWWVTLTVLVFVVLFVWRMILPDPSPRNAEPLFKTPATTRPAIRFSP
jgi:type IV secretion system protein VirD4